MYPRGIQAYHNVAWRQNGDIVKLDVSVFVDGFHGDCCGTFAAGEILNSFVD